MMETLETNLNLLEYKKSPSNSLELLYFLFLQIAPAENAAIFSSCYPIMDRITTRDFKLQAFKLLEQYKKNGLFHFDPLLSIRKSFFDDCKGERFERILVSLSTLALIKTFTRDFPDQADEVSKIFKEIPKKSNNEACVQLSNELKEQIEISSTSYNQSLESIQQQQQIWNDYHNKLDATNDFIGAQMIEMTNEIKQLLNIINEDEDVLKILTEKYTELQRDFDDKFHTLEKCKFKIMDWISINENNIQMIDNYIKNPVEPPRILGSQIHLKIPTWVLKRMELSPEQLIFHRNGDVDLFAVAKLWEISVDGVIERLKDLKVDDDEKERCINELTTAIRKHEQMYASLEKIQREIQEDMKITLETVGRELNQQWDIIYAEQVENSKEIQDEEGSRCTEFMNLLKQVPAVQVINAVDSDDQFSNIIRSRKLIKGDQADPIIDTPDEQEQLDEEEEEEIPDEEEAGESDYSLSLSEQITKEMYESEQKEEQFQEKQPVHISLTKNPEFASNSLQFSQLREEPDDNGFLNEEESLCLLNESEIQDNDESLCLLNDSEIENQENQHILDHQSQIINKQKIPTPFKPSASKLPQSSTPLKTRLERIKNRQNQAVNHRITPPSVAKSGGTAMSSGIPRLFSLDTPRMKKELGLCWTGKKKQQTAKKMEIAASSPPMFTSGDGLLDDDGGVFLVD